MKIETAPPEWLRAVVEAVCVALEINPAMLPTDPHLAGETVATAAGFARDEARGENYELPLGATEIDGIPTKATPIANNAKQREWLNTLANRLESASRDARAAAEEAANAIDNEILALKAASKETPK